MSDQEEGQSQNTNSSPANFRGPEGIGREAARALGESVEAGESVGAMAQELFLKDWFVRERRLFDEAEWLSYNLIANHTAEHEVRYRAADHRAVKKTWPGTYGNIPRLEGSQWVPKPADPHEYLARLDLQNELFEDSIKIEGAIISSGPSMVIGQPANGLSIISSQPWLDSADSGRPHPDESEVAELMGDIGFTCLFGSLFGWKSTEHSLIVLDAKPDNFIATTGGILPIDLLITECCEDLAAA